MDEMADNKTHKMERCIPFILFLLLVYSPISSFSRADQGSKGSAANGEATSDQLLLYDEATRQVVLHQNTLDKLASLPGPLHVITAIGDARIGKSTAFNVMAAMLMSKDKKGKISSVPSLFNVCQSLETCTKGVWLHTLPLTDGGHLVMLDVEGTDLGRDMITTQFSLLTSLLSSDVLVFLKESFPKRTGIFLHELARLKDRVEAHPDQVPSDQTLYVIIRDPLKPPQDVSLKTYVTQVLTDPAFCIDAIEECKLLEKHFPLSQVNVYSLPYVSRRHQKSFEWALKDKTYLKTMASLTFDIRSHINLSVGTEATGTVLAGIVRTFIQTLVHSEPAAKGPALETKDTCEQGSNTCRSTSNQSPSEVGQLEQGTPEVESLSSAGQETEVGGEEALPGPQQVGSLDVEKIIKSPFETMGPGVYSFVMNNVLRMKPSPQPSSTQVKKKGSRNNEEEEEEDEDDEEEDGGCRGGYTDSGGCDKTGSGQTRLTKWGKAIHEFIDDISDALDDFFSSVLAE